MIAADGVSYKVLTKKGGMQQTVRVRTSLQCTHCRACSLYSGQGQQVAHQWGRLWVANATGAPARRCPEGDIQATKRDPSCRHVGGRRGPIWHRSAVAQAAHS
jgi:hypothetical protein